MEQFLKPKRQTKQAKLMEPYVVLAAKIVKRCLETGLYLNNGPIIDYNEEIIITLCGDCWTESWELTQAYFEIDPHINLDIDQSGFEKGILYKAIAQRILYGFECK